MFQTRRLFQFLLTSIIILSFSLSIAQPQLAYAQGGDGIKRQVNAESGKVSFVGPESGQVVSASKVFGSLARPTDPAFAVAKRFASEFGLKTPERDLSVKQTKHLSNGRVIARYQQNYGGVPVMGGELIVNTNDNGDLYSMSGEVSEDLSLSIQPSIDAEQAKHLALEAVARGYRKTPADFLASEPELWIFDESLLRLSTRPVELVWRLEVTSIDKSIPLRELVLVNALKGSISLHFNQVDTAWHARGNESSREQGRYSNTSDATASENSGLLAFSPLVSTYTANSTPSLPGSFLCNQSRPICTNGSDSHADAAHKYAMGTFNMYDTQHHRNSIDNNGMRIVSTVHYCDNSEPFPQCPYGNAFWSGDQMVYGDAYGFPLGDDVVAHELTHGVTQHESNLFYYYQSGAMNESFSDLWGEYFDQTNNQGTDTAAVKWQIGEDVSGYGAFRSMSNPTAFGDPDRISSPNYYQADDDNGGVHHNSGVNSKAVYLMVDGGTFNGKTVAALGWVKTIAIYYEAQTNLLISGSDYSDLYYALQQACSNLIGQKGITSANCQEVKDAIDAVEMNSQPIPNFNTEAPLCNTNTPIISFADDLESGTSNWTFTNGNQLRWQYDPPASYGPYAHSGSHSLYANDSPAAITDAKARLATFTVPNNAYLHFAQAFGFESYGDPFNFDGGVLEYSITNGSTWLDAGSLIDFNGYNGTIYNDWNNPLKGRSAFVGSSHGYISTRLNLASLAGRSVTFRWRMGLDDIGVAWGWWVDDVKVYTCSSTPAVNVLVDIAGINRGTYSLAPDTSISRSYSNVNNGPVKVRSTNGVPIVASERVAYSSNGGTTWTSYSELMGLPANLVHTSYTFPWYNNLNLDSQLRIGNVGNTPTDVTVNVASVNMGTSHLNPYETTRISYPGLDKGPVKVISSGNVPIIVSMRVAYNNGSAWTSFSEMMGLPSNKLTNSYTFPWYNNASLDSQLRFGNVGTASTNVTVTVGGVVKGTYPLAPNQSQRVSYSGLDSGPVKITSSGNVPIIASLRVADTPDGGVTWTDFSEMMGLPTNALSTNYFFPAYNNVHHNSQLRFGNVGTASTNVTVTINGVVKGTYSLAPNASRRINYPGLDSGPVVIQSNGQPIIASLRVAYTPDAGVTWTSFAEMMGLPQSQLTTSYYFPWYNNLDLDTQLRIGVP